MVLCGLNESNFQVWKSLEEGEEQNGAVYPRGHQAIRQGVWYRVVRYGVEEQDIY